MRFYFYFCRMRIPQRVIKVCFWSLLAFLGFSKAFSQSVDPDQWYTYKGETGHFVPYMGEPAEAIFTWVSTRGNESKSLDLKIPKGYSYFINHQYGGVFDREKVSWSLDSLQMRYGESFLLTLYHARGIQLSAIQIHYGAVDTLTAAAMPYADLKPMPRKEEKSGLRNFFIIGFWLILGFFAFVRLRYPKRYKFYFSFSHLLSTKLIDESDYRSSVANAENLSFLFLYSLLVSFMLLLIAPHFTYLQPYLPVTFTDSYMQFLGLWGLGVILFMAIMLLKYGVVQFMSTLFGFRGFTTYYFYEFLQTSLIELVLLFGLWTLGYSFLDAFTIKFSYFFIDGLLILMVLRGILLYYKILKTGRFKNLYLFSYFCTTELIPLVLILKFFVT